jgi:4-amino-4-deoxy-L-arabinose transferase-like glycosyltransferase
MSALARWLEWGGMFTDLLVLSAAAALVLLPALGQTRYLANRELRQAEISREMAQTHDYIVPHLLGTPHPDKPPPMHATAAVFMAWWGRPSVFLARLPSALAALGAAAMTYGLGRALSDRRLGLVAALALLAIPGFTVMAQQARPDMVLCFAIAASALASALGMKECRRRGPRGLWFVVAGTAAGLGVVTKGPYGLLFPLFFVLLSPIRRPDWRRPRLEWVGFATALLAVAGVWAVPAYVRDGGHYLREVVFQSDLDVTKGASPWYGLIAPAIFLSLPMGVFLPMAIRDLRRHGYSAPLACAAAMFLVVQAVPKKRPHYLVPMYPFLALGLAMTIVRHAADSKRIRRGAVVLIVLGAAVVPLYFGVAARWVEHPEDPDLSAARDILAVVEPHTPIYVLVHLDESLAWLGEDARRVVWVDVRDPQATRQLQSAPGGSYLVMTRGQRDQLLNVVGTRPLEAIRTVEWRRRKLDEMLSFSKHSASQVMLLRFRASPAETSAR